MAKKQVWLTPEQVELTTDILLYAKSHMDAQLGDKYDKQINKVCDAYCSRRVDDLLRALGVTGD